MKIKILISFIAILNFTCCNKSYSEYAQKIKLKLEEINNKNNYASISVDCDSIEIIVLSNPTSMKLEYDTIIKQTLDEEDFIIIEYNEGKRLLQRIEADDFRYKNLHFEDFNFKRNDTIRIQRSDCNDEDEDEKWKCHIVFKK